MGTVMIQQTITKYKLLTAENIKKNFPHGAFMSKNMGNFTGLFTIFKLNLSHLPSPIESLFCRNDDT